MSKDQKLLPTHVSLYMGLFQTWNLNRFENPVSIVREEVMKIAKIGSFSTYTKCLRELHEWRYIEYIPSHNPAIGTRVNLYDFCNSNYYSDPYTTCNTSVTDAVRVKPFTPYSNINKQNKERETENAPTFEEVVFFFLEQKFPESEAKKFYNHYQSNGWLVGGKSPMKDWKAASEKWMTNTEKFNAHEKHQRPDARQPKAGQLHSTNDKDYSEPL